MLAYPPLSISFKMYYKTARADNCVEKVTQQWHDRDQTESLNATVDSCFAVIAARQHSVATSSSD